MKSTIPRTVWQVNPIRNKDSVTFNADENQKFPMTNNSRPALWAAVLALMEKHYGKENLNRLARDAKVGPGTASRIKAMETSVGLDTLDKLADFFGVAPWQLLIPGFDPDELPPFSTASPMARDVAGMLDAMDDERRQRAYALIVQIVEFGAAPAQTPEPSVAPKPEPHRHK